MDKNDVGDWLAMRAALDGAGFGLVDLRKCRSRGNGPPVVEEGRRVLYRWSDVLAWAEARQPSRRPHRIDLGQTTLGRWLEGRETAYAFAQRLDVHEQFIHRLIGHRNTHWRERLPPPDVLMLVSLSTGITIGTLADDAVRVATKGGG